VGTRIRNFCNLKFVAVLVSDPQFQGCAARLSALGPEIRALQKGWAIMDASWQGRPPRCSALFTQLCEESEALCWRSRHRELSHTSDQAYIRQDSGRGDRFYNGDAGRFESQESFDNSYLRAENCREEG
jgi:hypothetical protein